MIEKFYIDNQLYLDFLEIEKNDIPIKNDNVNKQELCKLVEANFRKLARKYHPDYGGKDEDFKFLMKSKQKLIEDNSKETNVSLGINDNNFNWFDKNSLASKLGNQLFDLISDWKTDLNLKPLYKPTTSEDVYEWIFKILDTNLELCLNVINLSEELAELSHNLYSDDSLSVLVCLFVPSKTLATTNVAYDNSIMLTFNDKILIESSRASDISKYFENKENIKNDIQSILNDTFVSKNNNVLKTKKVNEAIDKDRKVLEYLQNLKLFSTKFDENAADFLDKL
jgi:hypothetical protein